MIRLSALRLAMAAALCLPLAPPAFAQDAAAPTPARATPLAKAIGQVAPTGPVASLFVLNARGATLADGKLTLTGASPSSIVFADRPVRAAGHIETAQFIETWLQGEDKFNVDPPNATVSVLGPDGSVADAVVTISAPVIEGDTVTFAAVVLEGALTGASCSSTAAASAASTAAWGAAASMAAMAAAGSTTVGARTTSPTTPMSRTRTLPGMARVTDRTTER